MATTPEEYYGNQKLKIRHVGSGANITFNRVFLTSFTDGAKTNFKSTTVYGRMDPLVNYQNTNRIINLSFVLPSSNNQEAIDNFKKLRLLFKMQYPTYTRYDAAGIQTAPICQVAFINFIKGEYGFFNGFDFSPVNESGYFIGDQEIEDGEDDRSLYPKEYKVSLSFTVLHSELVGFINKKPNDSASNTSPGQTGTSTANAGDYDPDDDASVKEAMV